MKNVVVALVLVVLLALVGGGVYWVVTQTDVSVSGTEVEGLEAVRPRDMKIAQVSSDMFIVEWQTEKAVAGYVKYGDTSNAVTLIAQDVEGAVPAKQHIVRVSGLTPGKKYYFWVMSDNVAFGKEGRALEVLTVSQ